MLCIDPNLTLATANQTLISPVAFIHCGDFLAKVDDVLVALLPRIEECECIENVSGANGLTKRIIVKRHAVFLVKEWMEARVGTLEKDARF